MTEHRQTAKHKKLILATPTVDIGYNFDRAEYKPRQNIDFLFIDAYTGDALVQRVGRAGRLLGKEQKDEKSFILAVVDVESYKVLQDLDGQIISRQHFNALAEQMPRKNDLYAYIKSGAIIEAFRTILAFEQGMSDEDKRQLDGFFHELQLLFSLQDAPPSSRPAFTYRYIAGHLRQYYHRRKQYAALHTLSPDVLDHISLALTQPGYQPHGMSTEDKRCFDMLKQRLMQARRSKEIIPSRNAAIQWIRQDLVAYFKDEARFQFRDSFQPPVALIYDPEHLHSSEVFANYSTLHFIKYYEAQWFKSLADWREAIGTTVTIPSSVDTDVTAYCCLTRLRERPLQIGLKLDARAYTSAEWEEQYAYQVTALHELEVTTLNEQVGLQANVRDIFSRHFVPTFVVWNHPESYTLREQRKLRQQARFYPLPLDVVFSDGRQIPYLALLGNMAFHICAEIPYWALVKDLHKTIKDDDQPIIC